MNPLIKAAALGLLVAGVVLVVLGVNAMNSPSSDISRIFTGAPTDRATGMLVGGIAMLVAGLVGLLPALRKR